jgi:hypothetical protein
MKYLQNYLLHSSVLVALTRGYAMRTEVCIDMNFEFNNRQFCILNTNLSVRLIQRRNMIKYGKVEVKLHAFLTWAVYGDELSVSCLRLV